MAIAQEESLKILLTVLQLEGTQYCGQVPDLPLLMRFSVAWGNGIMRTLTEIEAEHIKNVLARVGGNKTRAAEILGINRKTLREKLKKCETGV